MLADKGNILLVANWPSDVGYAWWLMENFWCRISEHFCDADRRCFLAYPELGAIPATIRAANIKVDELDFRDRSPGNLSRIREYVQTNRIQHVYLSDSPEYELFYWRLRSWGVRSIAIHDHTPGDRTVASGTRRVLKSMIHRLPRITADRYIAVSRFVYDRFLSVSCIPADKCAIASNGIVPIREENSDRGRVRREFSIADDAVIVVTTGRASMYKGIDFFIRCADRLVNRERRNELVFLFCGDGPDLQGFIALAEQLELGAHMVFAGRRDDVRELLTGCDIGFHASHGEVGYSLSILEYMSAGLATIVPDLPSTSGATRHGINGLLYEHRDAESACDAIRSCLDHDTRRRLAAQGAADVIANYNIENTNRQLISALEPVFG